MVREEGLEPTRPRTPGPKPGASANSATLAQLVSIVLKNYFYVNRLWKVRKCESEK